MKTRRGMTLVEVALAAFIFCIAVLVIFNNFNTNRRVSVANRDRTGAQLLAANLIEEVRAHRFGFAAPESWPDNTPPTGSWQEEGKFPQVQAIPTYVEGRPQQMRFYRQLSYEGSLVGKGTKNHDFVTVTISWKDPGHPALKELKAYLVVRRR